MNIPEEIRKCIHAKSLAHEDPNPENFHSKWASNQISHRAFVMGAEWMWEIAFELGRADGIEKCKDIIHKIAGKEDLGLITYSMKLEHQKAREKAMKILEGNNE